MPVRMGVIMNKVMLILTFLLSNSAFALEFYTIDTNQTIGREELAKECMDDTQAAQEKLIQIAERLSVSSDTLTVSSKYGVIRHSTGSTRVPSSSYQYFCVLDFRSKDSTIEIKRKALIRYTHLGRSNWETACEPSYQEAISNPNSPVSVVWLAWTLVQGRMCEVQTVTIKKNDAISEMNFE